MRKIWSCPFQYCCWYCCCRRRRRCCCCLRRRHHHHHHHLDGPSTPVVWDTETWSIRVTSYLRQKGKISNYLSFDCSLPTGARIFTIFSCRHMSADRGQSIYHFLLSTNVCRQGPGYLPFPPVDICLPTGAKIFTISSCRHMSADRGQSIYHFLLSTNVCRQGPRYLPFSPVD